MLYAHVEAAVLEELLERGEEGDIDVIENDIKERDHRDMTRAIAPLKQADDAVLVDSTEMTIDEVVAAIKNEVSRAMNEA